MKILALIDRTRAALICLVILTGYAVAGFYPFNFVVSNRVLWLSPGPGVSLSRYTMLRRAAKLDLSASPGVTLELLVQPGDEPSKELGKILVLFDGALPENLQLAQWRSGFILRTPSKDARGRRRYREMGSGAGAMPKGIRRCIAVTSGQGGTRFYSDGVLFRVYPNTVLIPDALRGELLVGTGANSGYGWVGRLSGFALFCEALDEDSIARHSRLWEAGLGRELASERLIADLYLFDEGSGRTVRDAGAGGSILEIPALYQLPYKTVLETPWENWRATWSHPNDLIVNVVGFMPFGFFYALYRERVRPRRRVLNVLWATVVSGAISMIIELLQIYLPSRSSSLTDVICNIVGGLLGALAVYMVGITERRLSNGDEGRPSSHRHL